MTRPILIYGACGGLLIVILQLVEYRFLVIEHSLEIYGALIAAIFASVKEALISSLVLKRKTPKGELAEAKA